MGGGSLRLQAALDLLVPSRVRASGGPPQPAPRGPEGVQVISQGKEEAREENGSQSILETKRQIATTLGLIRIPDLKTVLLQMTINFFRRPVEEPWYILLLTTVEAQEQASLIHAERGSSS
ncbi:putative GED domain-containing protein DNM1P46 [Manis javanica]|nr:putative GED domain-containing protein DNM1P46 [Manis javanica]